MKKLPIFLLPDPHSLQFTVLIHSFNSQPGGGAKGQKINLLLWIRTRFAINVNRVKNSGHSIAA